MEDEDEEEDLITRVSSDNEELSENEENLNISAQHLQYDKTRPLSGLEKNLFIMTGFLIIISSTCLLILLPLYTQSINFKGKGDAYTAVLFTCSVSTITFLILALILGLIHGMKTMLWLPLTFWKVLRLGLVYGLSTFLIIYSLDRNRVMCHLQDPIKGIVLVFSLVFYFCFCRKMLGLQKIFCATSIVVGLFISVDYGMCDEFRCRGYERQSKSDDSGTWSWLAHALWTVAYLLGLGLWTLHYTLMEELIGEQQVSYCYGSGDLVATVSRLVSSRDSRPLLDEDRNVALVAQPLSKLNGFNCVTLAMWVHIISFVLVACLAWTDIIPSIGTESSLSAWWNVTRSGLACHFSTADCSRVMLYGWLTMPCYVTFVLSTTYFLMLSYSSVFTVAMATPALPIAGLWWSLYMLNPSGKKGIGIEWSPAITGEFICSVLGLPIVLVGLCIMGKSYLTCPPSKRVEPATLQA